MLRQWLRYPVPVSFRRDCFNEDPIASLEFPVVQYELKLWGDGEKTELFYECTEKGCSGAGCPTFPKECEQIPEDADQALIEHTKRHSPDFVEEFVPIKPPPTPEEWDATCLRLVDMLESILTVDEISTLERTTEMRRKINERKLHR